jgi:hypothetical protein
MSRAIITADINDALHFTEAQKKEIIASYPAWEREARVKGVPSLGSGRVFPIAEERIVIERKDLPSHFARIAGLDFGWTHPTAAVELVHDRDADVVYITKTHRLKEASPIIHAAALRSWGKELRFAWPRDGRRDTLEGGGIPLAEQFRDQGLNMLHEHAQFEDGSVSVEAGLMLMLQRMETGKLKVFSHLEDWLSEFRLYHREDGKVFKEFDDLMCATRYALMMLRFAQTVRAYDNFRRELKYPRLGIV